MLHDLGVTLCEFVLSLSPNLQILGLFLSSIGRLAILVYNGRLSRRFYSVVIARSRFFRLSWTNCVSAGLELQRTECLKMDG